MNKITLAIFAALAVGYPLWVRLSSLDWALDKTLISNLFPAFGLLAFTLLWLHVISGVFEPWLRKQLDFDKFVHMTSIVILISIILHPLLLIILFGSNFLQIFTNGNIYIWLGVMGWFLLITYDLGKLLNKYDFFIRHWRKILIISNIGFLLTFFHSINLGSDLQTNPLRAVWIFYGITAFAATFYTYGVKKLLK